MAPLAISPAHAAHVVYEYDNLIPARLLFRYDRFLARVVLPDGTEARSQVSQPSLPPWCPQALPPGSTRIPPAPSLSRPSRMQARAHCPNTGPMVGLLRPREDLDLRDDDPGVSGQVKRVRAQRPLPGSSGAVLLTDAGADR